MYFCLHCVHVEMCLYVTWVTRACDAGIHFCHNFFFLQNFCLLLLLILNMVFLTLGTLFFLPFDFIIRCAFFVFVYFFQKAVYRIEVCVCKIRLHYAILNRSWTCLIWINRKININKKSQEKQLECKWWWFMMKMGTFNYGKIIFK